MAFDEAHGFLMMNWWTFRNTILWYHFVLLYHVFIRNIRIFEAVDFVFKEHLSCTVAVCRYKEYTTKLILHRSHYHSKSRAQMTTRAKCRGVLKATLSAEQAPFKSNQWRHEPPLNWLYVAIMYVTIKPHKCIPSNTISNRLNNVAVECICDVIQKHQLQCR